MMKLHEYDAEMFDGGCIAYLGKAAKVAVTENLQQPHTLTFEYPANDEKADMILENRIVSVEGQAYRIDSVTIDRSGTKLVKVKATHIFFSDAQDHHIPTIGNDTDSRDSTIGVDPYVVLRKAVDDTDFMLISDIELKSLGMKRIGYDGEKIDFFPTDKLNLYDAVKSVIEAYGRGEIYADNYRFAVVERIGADNGVRLTATKNMSKISIERQRTELATRLYPYGKDDLTVSSVNGGKPYIESPGAAKYGRIDKYKDYSDYTEAEKLLAHAKWDLMGEDNENRLDTPQITITGDLIDLAKLADYGEFHKISLGDTVHVYEGDTVYNKRIISITRYPYSTNQTSVTIGSPSNSNPFFVVWQRGNLLKTIRKNSTAVTGKIKTSYFNGTVNSTKNPVRSKNKRLTLDGDLLVIKDNSRERIRIGNNEGQFVFSLYDINGDRVVFFDEDGNGIFSGTIRGGKIESDTDISVTKDACVGQYLRVGYISRTADNSGGMRYIYHPDSGIIIGPSASVYTQNNGHTLVIDSDTAINLKAGRVSCNGKRILTEDDLAEFESKIN